MKTHRLKKYLDESTYTGDVVDWSPIVKDCKPFIKQIKDAHNLLLRGSHKSNPGIIKVKPRKDRRPMSTLPKIQMALDEYFKKRFGWKPRSEAVFCTGMLNTALFYSGSIAGISSVWPIGNFKYLWSNEISDLFGTLQDEALCKTALGADEWAYFLNDTTHLDKFVAKYQSTSLASGIDKGYEIMIGCKEYYMVSNEHTLALKKYFNIKMG